MELKTVKDKLVIADKDEIILDEIYVGCRYGGNMYNCLKTYENQKWTVTREKYPLEYLSAFTDGECYIAKSDDNAKVIAIFNEAGIFIKTEYENAEDRYIEPDYNMDYVALGGIWKNNICRCICNEISKRNGIRLQEMQSDTKLCCLGETEKVKSAVNVAFEDSEKTAVNIGFVTFEKYFSGVFVREDGKTECTLFFDNCVLPKGKTVESDWIYICTNTDVNSALCQYAKTVKKVNKIQLKFNHAPSGFCTWYYYLNEISEKTVFENLSAIDEMKGTVPLEVFQIDDGWGNSHTGEGNPERFPKGMKYYAEKIKEHNMIPGIWLTPFNFGADEILVKEHPECFIHKNGEFVKVGGQVLLDATHPISRKWIENLYKKITYQWGFRYIKLDHVATYISGGDFFDKNAGALQNMRAYFKAMRKGCHPDTFILGCTSPMMELAGLVDGVRTSGDVFENWESLSDVYRRNFLRSYTNGIVYWNDPDCLMLRTSKEEDKECRRLCSRTEKENYTFATAIKACGGTFMISDKLLLANEKMKKIYGQMFPGNGKAGKPVDIMTSYMPSVIANEINEKTFFVAFINWSDKTADKSYLFHGTTKVTDYWSEVSLGEYREKISVKLLPHESKLLVFEKTT